MTLPQGYDAEEEVRMIKAQEGWPFWPVLPVKRPGTDQCGIVTAAAPSTVIVMNMWSLRTGSISEQTKDAEHIEFESVEAMVADGWVGD